MVCRQRAIGKAQASWSRQGCAEGGLVLSVSELCREDTELPDGDRQAWGGRVLAQRVCRGHQAGLGPRGGRETWVPQYARTRAPHPCCILTARALTAAVTWSQGGKSLLPAWSRPHPRLRKLNCVLIAQKHFSEFIPCIVTEPVKGAWELASLSGG